MVMSAAQTDGKVPVLTPEQIMAEVDETGFCLSEFSDDTKAILENSLLKNLGDGFHVNNPEHRTVFERTTEIQSIIGCFKQRASAQGIAWNQILVCRVVNGGSKEKYRTHLDSHIYTIVVPLLMPEESGVKRGQLYIVPNYRRQPTSEISNFFSKMKAGKYRGEKNYQKVASMPDYQKVEMKFGQFLIFNGMRALHGNIANETQENRVTLISHFADPFPFGVGALLRFLRKVAGTRK